MCTALKSGSSPLHTTTHMVNSTEDICHNAHSSKSGDVIDMPPEQPKYFFIIWGLNNVLCCFNAI